MSTEQVTHDTREAWLNAAVTRIKSDIFDPLEQHLPPIIRVSPGLCGGKAIGLCVDQDCAVDGSINIFIDPQLDDVIVILATLLHELVHASVGVECKHGGMFKKVIREVGLEGKATQTYAEKGTELYATLGGIAAWLGDYPHAKLVKKKKETKKHPWISFLSPSNEDFIVRVNKNTVKYLGPPRDYNGEPMIPKNADDMLDDSEDDQNIGDE